MFQNCSHLSFEKSNSYKAVFYAELQLIADICFKLFQNYWEKTRKI